MSKVAIGFIIGVFVCGLVLFGARTVMPAFAGSQDEGGVSENSSVGLAGLMPDFEKIYQKALTMPFIKAESKITDPDIASFYHDLMEETGLTADAQ